MCLKLVDLARLTFGVRHLDSGGRFSFARKPILSQVVKGKMHGANYAPPLTTCDDQNLRAKKKRSGTHADALIAETPRTLLDLTAQTLSKSARVLTELLKSVPNLEQIPLC